jgi:hypothetical protein
MKRALVLAALVLVAVTAFGGDDDDPALARAKEIADLVVESPKVPASMFAKNFLAAVPARKMSEILGQVFEEGGKVTSVERLSGDRLQGRFALRQEKGSRTQLTLSVSAEAPHRIEGLFLKPLGAEARSFADVEAELAKLPGHVSFTVARLGSRSPAALASLNPDDPLAIGSSFKLYILGQLVADVAAGKRKWTDVVELRPERRSLPSGMIQEWPVGAPVTLHSLASLMISISDNTATDNLLATVGRQRVERHMEVMGASQPELSCPFLATGEMFRLKWGKKGAAERYLASDVAGKRRILDEIVKEPIGGVGSGSGEPTLISKLEWFASANDLARALDWLRGATVADPTARGILSINKAGVDPGLFRYVGFKGGSEPGVLELAWLLERKDGAWFAVCIGWNDPKAPVEAAKLDGIASRAIELVARGSAPRLY